MIVYIKFFLSTYLLNKLYFNSLVTNVGVFIRNKKGLSTGVSTDDSWFFYVNDGLYESTRSSTQQRTH